MRARPGPAPTRGGLPPAFGALGFALVSAARCLTDVRRFRTVMALALPCRFCHNLLVSSVPGLLSDVVGMALNLAMLAGLRRREPVVS